MSGSAVSVARGNAARAPPRPCPPGCQPVKPSARQRPAHLSHRAGGGPPGPHPAPVAPLATRTPPSSALTAGPSRCPRRQLASAPAVTAASANAGARWLRRGGARGGDARRGDAARRRRWRRWWSVREEGGGLAGRRGGDGGGGGLRRPGRWRRRRRRERPPKR